MVEYMGGVRGSTVSPCQLIGFLLLACKPRCFLFLAFACHLVSLVSTFSSFAILDTTGWGVSPRGAGYLFGSDVVAQFNAANDIDMICRAHQLVMEGYKWHFNETVLTVWSAPNYCYRWETARVCLWIGRTVGWGEGDWNQPSLLSRDVWHWWNLKHTNLTPFLSSNHSCGNVAAILELDEHLQKEFIIFEAAPQETRGIPSKKPVADYFLWMLLLPLPPCAASVSYSGWSASLSAFGRGSALFFPSLPYPGPCPINSQFWTP